MIVPKNLPYFQKIGAILGGIIGLTMVAIGVYAVIAGDPLNGTIMLLLGGFILISLVGRQLKMWERAIGVFGTVIMLFVAILLAFTVEKGYMRALLLLAALVWGFFVLLGIYNVFIKMRQPRSPG
ncbi:hypothetical protein [Methanocella sp. MCL-LM]|uniref:hypothetical protein n=1 Tax=Methanocella sp. MCL-LM TaxID=3412035 RepID=UPI003C75052C